MKTSFISLFFGSSITLVILLASGASLATEGITLFSAINLALGVTMYAATIAFWGDAKNLDARMQCLKNMTETLDALRDDIDRAFASKEKPPKANKKK